MRTSILLIQSYQGSKQNKLSYFMMLAALMAWAGVVTSGQPQGLTLVTLITPGEISGRAAWPRPSHDQWGLKFRSGRLSQPDKDRVIAC